MQGARCNTMQDKERFGFKITSILILKMHQDLKNEIMLMDFFHKIYSGQWSVLLRGRIFLGTLQSPLQKSKPLINQE
jgi:hypothetical protein